MKIIQYSFKTEDTKPFLFLTHPATPVTNMWWGRHELTMIAGMQSVEQISEEGDRRYWREQLIERRRTD